MKARERNLRKNSCYKQIKNGDSNSKFFYISIRSRIRRNNISGSLSKVDDIKNEVKNNFEELFKEHTTLRPLLEGVNFNQIIYVDKVALKAPFTLEEVKDVMWNFAFEKSLEPGSFSLNFFKVCWDLVCSDVLAFVNEFHSKARIPKAFSTSFLALIPKLSNLRSLDHYQRICLINSLYKFFSKLIVLRRKGVMNGLISKNKLAFLIQRHIQHVVQVMNEILYFSKRFKKKCLIIKVDFQKYFDYVSQRYINYVMTRMGFGTKWILWMYALVFNSSLSVLINGSPTYDFRVERDLR